MNNEELKREIVEKLKQQMPEYDKPEYAAHHILSVHRGLLELKNLEAGRTGLNTKANLIGNFDMVTTIFNEHLQVLVDIVK